MLILSEGMGYPLLARDSHISTLALPRLLSTEHLKLGRFYGPKIRNTHPPLLPYSLALTDFKLSGIQTKAEVF